LSVCWGVAIWVGVNHWGRGGGVMIRVIGTGPMNLFMIYRFSDLSVWVCYWLVILKCLWGGEEGIGGVEGIKIMRFCWVSLNDKYSACWP